MLERLEELDEDMIHGYVKRDPTRSMVELQAALHEATEKHERQRHRREKNTTGRQQNQEKNELVQDLCGDDGGANSMTLMRRALRPPNLHFNRWRVAQLREEARCRETSSCP